MRTCRFRPFIMVLLLFCSTGLHGQAPAPTKQPDSAVVDPKLAQKSSPEESGSPNQAMRTLAQALSGTWSLAIRFESESGSSPAVEKQGEETWRAGPGGLVIAQEERFETPDRPVFLFGLIWWDSKTKDFHGMECNSQNAHVCDVKGSLTDISLNWDGKQLIIDEIEKSTEGKKMLWHEVYSDITPTSFTQTGESGEPGGPLKRLLTIHATRVPDHSK
jgi:hypothetical protein